MLGLRSVVAPHDGRHDRLRRASAQGRVLVVDDDASLAEMLAIVLRQEGFDSRIVAAATWRWTRSATTGPTWCCST